MSESHVKSQSKASSKDGKITFDYIKLTDGQTVEIGPDFIALYDNDRERSVIDLIERHQD